MSFYLKLGLAVNDKPDDAGGPRVKRGDITHIYPFDVWEERSKGGLKTRKNNLLIYIELPDAVRPKVFRLVSKHREFGQWDDQSDGIETIEGSILAKRRVNIPPQKIQNKADALGVLVDWKRVADENDDYQPFENKVLPLSTDIKDFLWDKVRAAYLTHQQVVDNLSGVLD